MGFIQASAALDRAIASGVGLDGAIATAHETARELASLKLPGLATALREKVATAEKARGVARPARPQPTVTRKDENAQAKAKAQAKEQVRKEVQPMKAEKEKAPTIEEAEKALEEALDDDDTTEEQKKKLRAALKAIREQREAKALGVLPAGHADAIDRMGGPKLTEGRAALYSLFGLEVPRGR
jgi:hypothetical protein